MYKDLIRPLLFKIDPEKVHSLTFRILRKSFSFRLVRKAVRRQFLVEHPSLEREVFGIRFKNPVGLAAGFDKDAKIYKELDAFGFGFIEIGTLTPKPQPGNEKKRLFRLQEDQAIINRMGFNNGGVKSAVSRLKENRKVLIGGNIGKNKTTPNDKAADDYCYCFETLFKYVDYFVVNVSSPNTPGLRALQDKKPLTRLLTTLQQRNQTKSTPKPILLKIAPDLSEHELLDIIDIVGQTGLAGVIATNTTISKAGLVSQDQNQTGGLSGRPLKEKSTAVIRFLHEQSGGAFPIIGVGGIFSVEDALDKLNAGASLVQLYTGFIYEGPKLIRDINKELLKRM